MFKKSVTPEEVVEFLNELVKIDEEAVTNLLQSRVYCNGELADHETVQVDGFSEPGKTKVGLLGVLNGLFGVNDKGAGCIYFIKEISMLFKHSLNPTICCFSIYRYIFCVIW